MDPVVLRPLRFGQLLDEAFDLYRKHFWLLAGISAVWCIPTQLLQPFLDRTRLGYLVDLFISFVVDFVSTAAMTWAVSKAYLGEGCTFREAYGAALRRFWPLIGTSFVTLFFICVGLMMVLIPGIYMWVLFYFVAQVFVLEGLSYGRARARSAQLTSGHRPRILAILVLSLSLQMAVGYACRFSAAQGHLSPFLGELITGLGLTATVPFVAATRVLLYYDIRVKKEGFDIALLAEQMAERAQPAASPAPE